MSNEKRSSVESDSPPAKRWRQSTTTSNDEHHYRNSRAAPPPAQVVTKGKSLAQFPVVEKVFDVGDLLSYIFEFVGSTQFLFVAGTNRQFKHVYEKTYPEKVTLCNIDTVPHAQICLQAGKIPRPYLLPLWNLAISKSMLSVLFQLRYVYSLRPLKGSYLIAAELGQLDIFQWLNSIDSFHYYDEEICSLAAKKGHVSILQFIHHTTIPSTRPWNKNTCQSAASNNQWETLQWLIKHGCPACEQTTILMEQHR